MTAPYSNSAALPVADSVTVDEFGLFVRVDPGAGREAARRHPRPRPGRPAGHTITVLAQLLIAAAPVATAVIYGTDVFAAIVLRPALARVDDRTQPDATGYIHDYADRRLPVPGAIGLAAPGQYSPWPPGC